MQTKKFGLLQKGFNVIISSAPFRISFAGGGSDIPFYYKRNKGAVLTATIAKYVYISVHPYFNVRETHLKYSKNELVDDVNKIQHPIFCEVIKKLWPEGGIEVVSTADIPGGTGLGSSSAFTVALLHALYAYKGTFCSREKLARKACEIEIDYLKEPIGKQDQYEVAYGGLNFIEFNSNETVVVTPLMLALRTVTELESNLLLFYTGDQHKTREILEDQSKQVSADHEKYDNMTRLVELAYEMRHQLMEGELEGFAHKLHEAWLLKRTLSPKITNGRIDKYYKRAIEFGALGGKLLGAGGGGFLLLYCEKKNQDRLRKALFDLYELPLKFDWAGSRIIYVGERHTQKGFFY